MYQVDYYDTATGRLSKPMFNSIDAAHKFVKEKISCEDIQDYIRHLHNCRKLHALNYAKTEPQLSELYGDVDHDFPTIATLRLLVHRSGFYEYRIAQFISSTLNCCLVFLPIICSHNETSSDLNSVGSEDRFSK